MNRFKHFTPGTLYPERLVVVDPDRGPAATEAAFYRSADGLHVHLEIEGNTSARMSQPGAFPGDTIINDTDVSDVMLSVTITEQMALQLHRFLTVFLTNPKQGVPTP